MGLLFTVITFQITSHSHPSSIMLITEHQRITRISIVSLVSPLASYPQISLLSTVHTLFKYCHLATLFPAAC